MWVVHGLGAQLKKFSWERSNWYNLPPSVCTRFNFDGSPLPLKCECNNWMPPIRMFPVIKETYGGEWDMSS